MKKFDMKSLLEGIKSFQEDQWEVCKHYYRQHGEPVPVMAVVSVQPTEASRSYMRNKEKYFNSIGIPFEKVELNTATVDSVKSVIDVIGSNNADFNTYNLGTDKEPISAETVIGGMILQLPLPKELESCETELIQSIPHTDGNYLDVDGLCGPTVTELMDPRLVSQFTCLPCTPKGIMMIIDRYLHPEKSISELILHNYNWSNMLDGKTVTIVGRGKLVGRPLAMMCISAGATVTVCNSRTQLSELVRTTQKADIVVYATGKTEGFGALNCSSVKPQLIIDCGIGRNNDGKLVGDFKHDDNFYDNVTYTPVPGGVGPMTVAMLCQNFLETIIHKSEVE